jgi:hypothetical protein
MTDLIWIKAEASKPNGNCVELAQTPDGVAVRDSKDPDGPMLEFTDEQWGQFAECWAAGGLNYLTAQASEAPQTEEQRSEAE